MSARATYRGDMIRPRRYPFGLPLLAVAVAAVACVGCAPEPADPAAEPTAAASAPAPRATASAPTLLPFPTGPAESTTAIPTDCESLLPESVLAELADVPLNAPGMGGGIRVDSSRVCVWADPAATVTKLIVVIGYAPYREASDTLYVLGRDEGYTCYEPDGGVRCEKVWESATLGVQEGRTLFYRDGVIIDTQYAGLAPSGFTSSIVDTVWG